MIFLFIRMDLAKDNPALRAFDKPIRLFMTAHGTGHGAASTGERGKSIRSPQEVFPRAEAKLR
jgi:hypothetical protein